MPPTTKSPLAESSHRCLQLFGQLSSLLADKIAVHSISRDDCLDELGRFRMWANNIGAFLRIEHRNSLDFRLREAFKITSRIVELLEDLAESLGDGQAGFLDIDQRIDLTMK